MPREQRRDLPLDRFDCIVAVGRGEIEEDRRYPVERVAAAFERLDRVYEIRRLRIVRDRHDLAPRLIKRHIEGRSEMRRLDGKEGRDLERARPGPQKGIVGLGLGHVASVRRHLGTNERQGKDERCPTCAAEHSAFRDAVENAGGALEHCAAISELTYSGCDDASGRSCLGKSLDEIRAFPEGARKEAGVQLHKVQQGLEPCDWKPMPTIGLGVAKSRIRDEAGAFA